MSRHDSAVATKTGTWRIDPAHSRVGFGVRHMMFSTVKGSFPGVDGKIVLNEEDVTDSEVEVRIDASSIDTANQDRDKHLRSDDFLDVESHPHITFRSTGVRQEGDRLSVSGDLTIRGATRPVELEAEKLGGGLDPWGNQRVGFSAATRINRKDFGLTWNQALEAGGVLVGDEVRIALDIQAVEESGEE